MSSLDIKSARKRAARVRQKSMSDPVANPCCCACGFSYPPIVHMHHVYPLAETEQPIDECIWLCPNCHAMVHEIRRVRYSKGRVSNLKLRLSHLDYWLGDVCSPDVAAKLIDIARRSAL